MPSQNKVTCYLNFFTSSCGNNGHKPGKQDDNDTWEGDYWVKDTQPSAYISVYKIAPIARAVSVL